MAQIQLAIDRAIGPIGRSGPQRNRLESSRCALLEQHDELIVHDRALRVFVAWFSERDTGVFDRIEIATRGLVLRIRLAFHDLLARVIGDLYIHASPCRAGKRLEQFGLLKFINGGMNRKSGIDRLSDKSNERLLQSARQPPQRVADPFRIVVAVAAVVGAAGSRTAVKKHRSVVTVVILRLDFHADAARDAMEVTAALRFLFLLYELC